MTTSVRQGRGFWAAIFLASFLSGLSWMNKLFVEFFNLHLFHVGRLDVPGWWVYVWFRLLLVALLVYIVWNFPVIKGRLEPNGEKSFEPLMGIRALACFMVLMGHFFFSVFPFTSAGVPVVVQWLLRTSPWAGVYLFFALSGFLMGKGFVRQRYTLDAAGYRAFMRNRLLRIVPVYCIALFLVSLYRYPEILQWKHGWMILELLMFDYRGDMPINPIGALWSVSTEMQFYLLAPMLVLILIYLHKRMGRWFVLMPLLLLCAGTIFREWIEFKSHQMYTYGYTPVIPNLDIFMAGMSVNFLPKLKRKWFPAALAVSCVVFYVLISYVTFYRERFHISAEGYWILMPLLAVSLAAGLIYLAEMTGKMRGNAFLMAVQTMGTLTYCLYVFHPEVFILNGLRLPQIHSLNVSLLHFPLVIGETVAVAAFFYLAVEKPFDLKKRIG